jgi:hypothetical protein
VIYVLTFGGDPSTIDAIANEAAHAAKAAVDDWWLRQMGSGRVLLGARLAGPHAATTVRFVGGRCLIEDGPFTAEAESVGGFGIIEAANLDEALAIVRSWPIGGYIEIRPLAQPDLGTEVGSSKAQPGEIA